MGKNSRRTKISPKEDLALTAEWNAEVEMKIIEVGHEVSRLKAWLEEAKREDSQKVREDELKFKHKLFEARLHYQTELQAAKAHQAQKGEKETLVPLAGQTPGWRPNCQNKTGSRQCTRAVWYIC